MTMTNRPLFNRVLRHAHLIAGLALAAVLMGGAIRQV